MYNNIFSFLVKLPAFILIVLFFSGCARQIGPSGGPNDITPPEIVNMYPANRTLNYNDSRISLEFSKYMDRRHVEESIFLSPNLGTLTFDWGGKDVEIHFSDSLRQNTTYIFTLGTDAVDTRQPANHLAHTFALAFSTGTTIDSGSISGKVFDSKPAGVMVFAYQLNGRSIDSLNPGYTKPDYLTQTDKDGLFTLDFLKLGLYRLVAVRDEYKNLLYEKQTDQYGVTTTDVILSPQRSSFGEIQFKMSAEDTTAPFLSSAHSLDRNHVLLRFSEAMDISSADVRNVIIMDTLSNNLLRVSDFSFIMKPNTADGHALQSAEARLITSIQDSGKTYRVSLQGVRDLYGNVLSPQLNSSIFLSDAMSDTNALVFTLLNITEGSQNVRRDDSIHIAFSKAVKKNLFMAGFSLKDSSRRNVKGTFGWWNSTAVSFIPSSPMLFGMPYKLSVILDSLQDFSGNHPHDSIETVRFQIVSESILGSIQGTVAVESFTGKGIIFVAATPLSSKTMRPYQQPIQHTGAFLFNDLPEDKYILSAFIDADSNGTYSYGKPFPFHSAEQFVVYPDTLKVRARWPIEGVNIHF